MRAIANMLSMYGVPLMYIALIIYFALSLEIIQVLSVMLAFIFGIWLGDKVNNHITVQKRFGKIQYNRHPLIFLVWVMAVAIRIYVELFFRMEWAVFAMTAILAISTGMLISESLSLRVKLRLRKGQR